MVRNTIPFAWVSTGAEIYIYIHFNIFKCKNLNLNACKNLVVRFTFNAVRCENVKIEMNYEHNTFSKLFILFN